MLKFKTKDIRREFDRELDINGVFMDRRVGLILMVLSTFCWRAFRKDLMVSSLLENNHDVTYRGRTFQVDVSSFGKGEDDVLIAFINRSFSVTSGSIVLNSVGESVSCAIDGSIKILP